MNTCGHCYHNIDQYNHCSEFCSSIPENERDTWHSFKDGDWGYYPCSNCGCVIEDAFSEDRVCASCHYVVQAKRRTALLRKAFDYIENDELEVEIKKELGIEQDNISEELKKETSKTDRFRLISSFHKDLILAEERYLESCGWKRATIKKVSKERENYPDPDELLTVWKNPQFLLTYSRNHAIQICKARDETLGYW